MDNLVALTPATLVAQDYDDGHITIALHLHTIPDLITLLARALRDRDGMLDELAILGRHGIGSPRGVLALNTLLRDPAIREALTLRITPGDAQDLAGALDEAADVHTCERCDNDAPIPHGLCDDCADDQLADELVERRGAA